MATTPSVLVQGGISQILGSASSLAFAAPLVDGDPDAASLTSVDRIGWFWDRTASAEKLGLVVQGSEIAHLGVYGIRTITGAEGTPSFSFIGDPDVGVYNAGTNRLGVVTAGVERLRVYEGGGVALRGLAGFGADPGSGNMQAITYRGNFGDASTVTYSVAGFPGTGIWFPLSDSVAIGGGGVPLASFSTTSVTLYYQTRVPASTTSAASLRIPHGTAPTTPTDGDVWTTTDALFVRVSSESRRLANTNFAQTFTAKQTFVDPTTSAASITLPHGAAPTTPVNGDAWTTTAGLFLRINGATVGPINSTILFSQTQTVTVTGTTAGTLLGTGVGSITVPANYLTAGKKVRISATMVASRPANNYTATITITFGTWTQAFTTSSSSGARPVVLQAEFTPQAAGASVTLAGHFIGTVAPAGGGAGTSYTYSKTAAAFDTTASTTLALTAVTNQTNASVSCYSLTIESLFF